MLLKTFAEKATRLTCFFLFLLISYSAAARSYTGASFFIVAHEDDWQLFMGKHAKDMVDIPGRKLVFIYVTAGDAGSGRNANGNGKIPYFMARENAAARSTEFLCSDVSDSSRDGACMTHAGGHEVLVRRRKNTMSYFLRLPDGGIRGESEISLRKFYRKSLSSITSVDSVNTFDSWHDLVGTVRSIIYKESKDVAGDIEINMPDVTASRNPGDHMDHYLAGVLALSATKNDCYDNILYTGYNVSKQPKHITPEESDYKKVLLKNIGIELGHAGYPDCQDNWHMSFTENECSILEKQACSFPDSGVFYIRKFGLRQEDDDADEGDFSYMLYPNPATNMLHLSMSDKQRTVSGIRVVDAAGNMKKTFGVSDVGYAWEWVLNISDLQAGIYFLEITSGERKNTLRFLKQ